MKTYCVKCKKDTENIDSEMFRTKNNRLIMQSKCPVCGIKKSRGKRIIIIIIIIIFFFFFSL